MTNQPLDLTFPVRTVVALLVAAMLLLPAMAAGQVGEQSGAISSDRPGFGDGAHVLAPGVWQAEVGGTIHAQASDDFLVGTSLLRFGFTRWELRVFLPDLVSLNQGNFLRLGDLGAGVKVPMALGGSRWSLAAKGAITFATGSESVSAGDPTGSFGFIGETTVMEDVDFVMNAGYGALFNDLGGGALSIIATPMFAIPGRDGLSFYLGYAGFIRSGDNDHIVEWGLTKLSGVDRQWDVNAGIDPGSRDWFLGVGFAVRRR